MIQRHTRTPIMHRIVEANGVLYFGGIVAEDKSASMRGQTEQILSRPGPAGSRPSTCRAAPPSASPTSAPRS